MRKIQALIQRTAHFVSVRFALPGGRLVSFTVPRYLTGPELKLIAEVLCDQALTEQVSRCPLNQQEAVN